MAYGIRERAVMIALAALGGRASNAKLKKDFGLDFSGQKHKQLSKLRMLEVHQTAPGRPIDAFVLTDAGWAWVEEEMGAKLPANAGAAGGALYALLAALKPVADTVGGLKALLSGSVAQAPETALRANDLREQIRSAYRSLAKRPQDWVQLRDLRPKLDNATKLEVDSTLKQMLLDKEINVTLNDDQGSLTQADRQAAIRIGVNDMHMLSMG